jgi:transposase-like protein
MNERATTVEKPFNNNIMPVCPRCKDESSFNTISKGDGDRTCDECGRKF